MAADTQGLTREFEGKVLPIFFNDGVIAEVKLLNFELHENCHH
jgi:hypothetical protein